MAWKHGLVCAWCNPRNLLTIFPPCQENDGLCEACIGSVRPAYTWDSMKQHFCRHKQIGNWERAQDHYSSDESIRWFFLSFSDSWWTWNVNLVCCALDEADLLLLGMGEYVFFPAGNNSVIGRKHRLKPGRVRGLHNRQIIFFFV